ncbi:DUF4942 domain-containing protein [Streptomyces sp. SID6673]|nr:DUF4942 domain-containing protein [Streptomyces sp. SID11726]NDZ94904.1 DUF4942 domain-containing protein [Streptomyces sp. SID11726]NEB23064.1 DUF4942 domain-containing protein [Streptomyces sp. SID6673]
MFGADFYPTPQALASEMLAKLDLSSTERVLEPSAGRGDLVEALLSAHRSRTMRPAPIVDVVEYDHELAAILKSKGFTLVAHDFLTFESYAQYDAIVMNPPFSNGAAHLTKALDVMKSGGDVVCLLNAETLRNPHTAERKVLAAKLEALDASIEYKEGAFTAAARTTDVEIALIHVKIERKPQSDILKNLVQAKQMTAQEYEAKEVVDGDALRGAVRRYEVEAEAGLKLIDEYNALKPILTHEFSGEHSRPIIELKVGDTYGNQSQHFVERLRMKYWREAFSTSEMSRLFTSATREKYQAKVAELARYEFNLSNIKQVQSDLAASMLDSLDDSIVKLFDGFCEAYWDEGSNNVHYYNGWKTNKAYRVNKKVITRLNAWGWLSYPSYTPASYARERLEDIAKVFAYLDGVVFNPEPLRETLEEVGRDGQTRNVELEYFTVTFYKKGTTHIVFKRDDLLKKFNLIGSQRKGWLPPEYGRTAYSSMTPAEREVVDEFEGEESYVDTVQRVEFYESRPTLGLGAGL